MPVQIITSVAIDAQVNLGTTDDAVVTASGLVAHSTDTAIYGTGSFHFVQVSGEVVGLAGIVVGDSQTLDANNMVVIQSSGRVTGYSSSGVEAMGQGSLVINYGKIDSSYNGISIAGDGAKAINYGTVTGLYGIVGASAVNSVGIRTIIENYGTVIGVYVAIFGDTDFDNTINNFGSVIGDIYVDLGNDIVTNRGLINGNTYLGGGNDLYDNSAGRVIGVVSGGDGNDTFKPGAGFDDIDGGTGNDVIDFRGSGAVQVSLDGSIDGTGNADQDSYVSIEGVHGSSFGDLLIGQAAANSLRGLGGADTIMGEAGSDKIYGGAGVDVLSGAVGNDLFIFDRISDCGDSITDFGNALGDQDRIMIRATAFGGGLVAGTVAAGLFQARADNVAQDADDRFIFRSTDKTLWFDVDGAGALGPVMVADLQAAATFAAVDIGLF